MNKSNILTAICFFSYKETRYTRCTFSYSYQPSGNDKLKLAVYAKMKIQMLFAVRLRKFATFCTHHKNINNLFFQFYLPIQLSSRPRFFLRKTYAPSIVLLSLLALLLLLLLSLLWLLLLQRRMSMDAFLLQAVARKTGSSIRPQSPVYGFGSAL